MRRDGTGMCPRDNGLGTHTLILMIYFDTHRI